MMMILITGLIGIALLVAFLGIMVWWVKALPLIIIVVGVIALLIVRLRAGAACRLEGARLGPKGRHRPAGPSPIYGSFVSFGLRRFRRRAEMLREEGERPAPGKIGRRLVVAGSAGVVVEGVLGAGIFVDRIFLVVGFQRAS